MGDAAEVLGGFDRRVPELYRQPMKTKHAPFASRAARVVAGVAVAVTLSGIFTVPLAYAADEAKPAGEQAVADRYVVAVSGMT